MISVRPSVSRQVFLVALAAVVVACVNPYANVGDGGDVRIIGACYDAGRSACGPAQACIRLTWGDGTAHEACHVVCTPGAAGNSCPVGQVCRASATGDKGYCLAPCTSDVNCGDGFRCDVPSGVCICTSEAGCQRVYGVDSSCGSQGICRHRCVSDAECACGTMCRNNRCEPGCAANTDCCGTSTCASGRCTATTTTSGVWGRCVTNDMCPAGTFCWLSYPRGACEPFPLDLNCDASSCPAGNVCAQFIGTDSRRYFECQEVCTAGSACTAGGTVCATLPEHPTQTACRLRCRADGDCGPERRCDTSTGVCLCAGDAFCQHTLGTAARCSASTGLCSCTRNCTGRNCGTDGCGGQCGTCATTEACGNDGLCFRPFCGQGGTVPCTGYTCPPGSTCIAPTSCRCASGATVNCAGEACASDRSNCQYPNWRCR